jgi:glycosyltransferase involved in cell wall biosynthesis
MQASVIVTTYNWPAALKQVLLALAAQTTHDFEIIIADDGSKIETKQCVEDFQKHAPIPVHHVWQPDDGFRAAQIRNKAIAISAGDLIIFLDGDCIPLPNFVEKHCKLALPSYFIAGNRVLLSQSFTQSQLANSQSALYAPRSWWMSKFKGECNRILPFLSLPLGPLRKMSPLRWKGAKTCNLSVWRKDLLAINGFDERYQGWGFEDSDLVIRLLHHGVHHLSGRFALPVLHLWHPENSRVNTARNLERLKMLQQSKIVWAEIGLSQWLNQFE